MTTRKVLIVEDDQAMAVALRDGFTYEGYSVQVARDGAAGLRLASSHEWGPGHVTTADIPDIHRIGNAEASGRDLVTLHCYAPPFDSIRTYKLGSTETGTLVPEAPREVGA
jgi:DNA-binding response OmpR family regulator